MLTTLHLVSPNGEDKIDIVIKILKWKMKVFRNHILYNVFIWILWIQLKLSLIIQEMRPSEIRDIFMNIFINFRHRISHFSKARVSLSNQKNGSWLFESVE